MRTVYLGTSDFAATVLDALAASAAPAGPRRHPSGRPPRARPEARAAAGRRARRAARHRGLQPEDVNGAEARERIAAAEPEAVLICAFGALIQEPLLSDHELLNVHPSLLPRWRGAAPIERAIEAGDEETGVTIMRPTAELDAGPIALQRAEAIRADDDYGSLSERLAALGGELLVEALDLRPSFREQPDTGVTYAEKIGPEDRLLDPALTADLLERRVRALTPHVGAYIELPWDERLGVTRAALPQGSAVAWTTRPGARRRRPAALGSRRDGGSCTAPRAARSSSWRCTRRASVRWTPSHGFGATASGSAGEPLALLRLHKGESLSAGGEETTQTGPDCPSCGERWLRGTNLPGRYRCVYCLHRFELRSRVPELRGALDDRADVRHRQRDLPQLRRVDALAHLAPRSAAGATSTGIPFSTAFPDSGSTSDSSASTLLLTPAWAEATLIRTPAASWPQPCGIETTPGMIPSVTSTGASSEPVGRAHRGPPAVAEPEPLRVVGVDVERAALLALHERGQVVHPRVVRAQLAAADEQDAAVPLARERVAQAVDVGDDRLGRQLDLPGRRAQHLRQPRRERAEVDPVRVLLEHVEREPVRIRPEPVAVGTRRAA